MVNALLALNRFRPHPTGRKKRPGSVESNPHSLSCKSQKIPSCVRFEKSCRVPNADDDTQLVIIHGESEASSVMLSRYQTSLDAVRPSDQVLPAIEVEYGAAENIYEDCHSALKTHIVGIGGGAVGDKTKKLAEISSRRGLMWS